MAKQKHNASKLRSLSHGRPPTLTLPSNTSRSNLSSQTTRTVIRKHHNLLKAHTRAVAAKDEVLAEALQKEIDENGGLAHYQAASILGQSSLRGGDTSKHLLEWLSPIRQAMRWNGQAQTHSDKGASASEQISGLGRRLRMLDVGALSTDTAAGRSGLFDMTRIDLNSQEKGIMQQDFMQRPLPRNDEERFDIVCLSLVVNYVPDAKVRGEMLRRVQEFLVKPEVYTRQDEASTADRAGLSSFLPALWLVLPAPCVTNSRYMTVQRLGDIMASLGYELLESKITAKLAYFLFRHSGTALSKSFAKVEVNPGRSRNNFVILTD